jgi:uracil-DNA glycosylase
MSPEEELEKIASEIRECVKCPLHESRKNAVPGEGPEGATVVFIGEGPGANEDEQGRPFVGSAGHNLDSLLSRAGLARKDVFITNVVKCRPPGNRRPLRNELDACHPYLRRQLEIIRPKLVVLLGDAALKEFFPDGTLAVLHGRATKRGELTFVPMYHPASVIYNRALGATLDEDFARLGELVRGSG